MSRASLLLMPLLFNSAFVCIGAPQQTVLPFQLSDNLIRVPVRLNGQAVEAVLDSGTGGLGIDGAFATSLGLHLGTSSGLVPGGGKPVPMYPVMLDALDFGSEHLEHVSAIALSFESLSASAGFPVHMLLGRPVFADRAVLINYPGRTVTFLPVGVEPSCTNPVPLTFWGGTPLVVATMQSTATSEPVRLNLIVDLGTRHFAAMLGGPFLDTTDGKKLEESGHATQVGTGTGGAVMGSSVSVANLTVGSKRFSNLQIALTRNVGAFAKGGADGSLGVPMWENATIILDYPHKKFCLERPRSTSFVDSTVLSPTILYH